MLFEAQFEWLAVMIALSDTLIIPSSLYGPKRLVDGCAKKSLLRPGHAEDQASSVSGRFRMGLGLGRTSKCASPAA